MVEERAGNVDKMKYGIMQGRLTPQRGRGIQFFPFENWQQEFTTMAALGMDEIEWIFDYDRYQDNPLFSNNGQKDIQKVIADTGVYVHSVCFDYFMRRPFYKAPIKDCDKIKVENESFIKKVCEGMANIGANLLEIPLVDNSSIKTDNEKKLAIEFLNHITSIVQNYQITIGLETDFPPVTFNAFLKEVPLAKANYDTGNSSGMGYNPEEEILSLGSLLANLHIKDRVVHGTTVKLGTGSADFDKVFSSLKRINYSGSIILQAARSKENAEKTNIAEQFEFVKRYVNKYHLGEVQV
jgi:hexulose-6-phosphate isomerase